MKTMDRLRRLWQVLRGSRSVNVMVVIGRPQYYVDPNMPRDLLRVLERMRRADEQRFLRDAGRMRNRDDSQGS